MSGTFDSSIPEKNMKPSGINNVPHNGYANKFAFPIPSNPIKLEDINLDINRGLDNTQDMSEKEIRIIKYSRYVRYLIIARLPLTVNEMMHFYYLISLLVISLFGYFGGRNLRKGISLVYVAYLLIDIGVRIIALIVIAANTEKYSEALSFLELIFIFVLIAVLICFETFQVVIMIKFISQIWECNSEKISQILINMRRGAVPYCC